MEKDTFPDATVVAASREYIWVEVNRDHTPKLAKRFNVSAYPSCIVLGRKQEKVYRFQSYMKPEEFVGNLKEGLRRWELYTAGKEWDDPNPRPQFISDEVARITTIKAPSEGVPDGIAFQNGDMWVAQDGELFQLNAETGVPKARYPIPRSVLDLASDGSVLYAVDSAWTAGKPIYLIDPQNGKTVRTIVTESNLKYKSYAAKGIAWANGKLFVLDGARGQIHEVNPETGEIARTIETKLRAVSGLAFDGHNLAVAGRNEITILDEEGKHLRKIKVNYPVRSLEFESGVWFAMEQPIFGFDKQNKSVRIWPRSTMIYRFFLPE